MERDYAFEALAEVTGTDWTTGRGELNASLKSIREEAEIEDSYLLADVIHERAKMYREVMPDVMLTPSALAKHWKRVLDESGRKNRPQGTNRAPADIECSTCSGDRFVVISQRKPVTTIWMQEHGITAREEEMIEEYAPCPDCNSADISFRRSDGTKAVSPDAAKVREMMSR